MRRDESLQPREAEHLPLGVVSLYQTVAVEEDAVALLQHSLLLLVEHAGHKPKGHPSRPKLRGVAGSHLVTQVGKVVTGVGVAQLTAAGIQNGVEARDEHVGRDVAHDHVVYLP